MPMVLGGAQPFPLLETPTQDESQPKGRGCRERRQSQDRGGQSVGSQGDTKVSAPKTELCLLTHCPWNFSFLFHAAQL